MTNISQEELDISLLQSALSGHATACKVLLQLGANPNAKQPSEGIGPGGMGNYHGGGNSPLHHAACNGHTDVCNMLLEYGADINIRNSSGYTPLFVSVYKNHRTTGLYLVSRGADTIYFGAPAQAHDQTNNSRHLHVNATDFKGMSMHTAAIRLGDVNRLTELLSQPGDEDKAELLKGLVKEAKSAKRPDIVAFLQAKGAAAQISSVRKQASQQP